MDFHRKLNLKCSARPIQSGSDWFVSLCSVFLNIKELRVWTSLLTHSPLSSLCTQTNLTVTCWYWSSDKYVVHKPLLYWTSTLAPPRNWQPVWKKLTTRSAIGISCENKLVPYTFEQWLGLMIVPRRMIDALASVLRSRRRAASPGNLLSSAFTSLGFSTVSAGFSLIARSTALLSWLLSYVKPDWQQCLFTSRQVALVSDWKN